MVKFKYFLLMYFLSLWQILILVDIFLVILGIKVGGVICIIITAILIILDKIISHKLAYPDGKLKEFCYK